MQSDVNPMQSAHAAPRCSAHAKRTGEPCQAPAVAGWTVCRLHGAGGGHPAGPSHPRWTHGMRSQSAVDLRRMVNEIAREARQIEKLIGAVDATLPA
jgi:hypothetical protein